nr:PREDICTED: rab11 family-interacting protein 4 isoform X3 [Bemisia tabaci]XP_018899023.1 PREDICTED: rab11 family-interacting protein 4 isoform X3 [Bemisia tabaci]
MCLIMSISDEADPEEDNGNELEYDLWEGQFEISNVDQTRDLLDEIFNCNENLSWINPASPTVKPTKINGFLKQEVWKIVKKLSDKVELLQQQMSVLADNQTHADERYTRAKQENAALQARVLMLEEQLREVELRSEERLAEEAKRHRELVARVDRENQLQVENCAIKLQTVELENKNLRDEALRCRSLAEKAKEEKRKIEENLIDAESNVITLREEIEFFKRQEQKYMEQSRVQEQLLKELSAELEQLRQERNAHIAALNSPNNVATELQQQLDVLRTQYRNLQEQYDELQALLLSRSVEEGRTLLTGSNSLAAELEAMTQDDSGECSLQTQKMKTALKEQQEVNSQLRAYIDGILLNIVENYPQLLEVKCTPSSSSTSSGPNS